MPELAHVWFHWTLVGFALSCGLRNTGGRRGLGLSVCPVEGGLSSDEVGRGASPSGPQATSAGSIPMSLTALLVGGESGWLLAWGLLWRVG